MKPTSDNSGDSNPEPQWPMRFVHKFKCGVVATATLTETGQYEVHWSYKPKVKKIEREYFVWRAMIMAKFEEATGIKVLVVTI